MKEHSFPNGTVAVKMHKRKRLTMVVAREDLDAALIDRIEELEHENRVLRRKVTALTEEGRDLALVLEAKGVDDGSRVSLADLKAEFDA